LGQNNNCQSWYRFDKEKFDRNNLADIHGGSAVELSRVVSVNWP